MIYLDIDGLSTLPTEEERERYGALLAASRANDTSVATRLCATNLLPTIATLARAQNEVVVLTGPASAPQYCLSSETVFVTVVPDNYDYKYRTTNVREWSYRYLGCTEAEIKTLLSFTDSPTKRHRLYDTYHKAAALEEQMRVLLNNSTPPTAQTSEAASVDIIRHIGDQLQLLENLSRAPKSEQIALDLEWVIGTNELIGVNIATTAKNYYIPVLGKDFDQHEYQGTVRDAVWRLALQQPTIWHNAKADIGTQLGADPLYLFRAPLEDTILCAYVAGEGSLGLKELTERRLGRKAIPLPKDLHLKPIELAARYGAAGDARNTLDLYNHLLPLLHSTNQYHIYAEIERPLVPVIASMEKYGIPLDMQEVQRLRDVYFTREEAIRSSILSSHSLDFAQDAEQRAYLSKNGFHSSSLDQRNLQLLNAPWVKPLLEFRQSRTLRRSFLDKHLAAWREAGCPSAYRAYPGFNQAGRDASTDSWINAPATGRLSSSNPNLQNQPRSIRSSFIAPPGYKLVSLDYSALELCVAAGVTQDRAMLATLNSGGDIHEEMRRLIEISTGVDVGRPVAKAANFNLRYGGQADMLISVVAKEGGHLSYDVASSIVEVDRQTYVDYWNWFNRETREATQRGYSASLLGRRRYNSDLKSLDPSKQGHAQRAATNMVIQATAADIVKRAMGLLTPLVISYKAHLALQVHDELVFWVPEAAAEAFLIAAKQVMESIPLPGTSLKVEGHVGRTWAEAH